MRLLGTIPFQLILAMVMAASAPGLNYELASLVPPKPMREFRGAWVATVNNKDWPSKPGLSTAQQKSELLAILDRAAQLKLNAIIFQVRPACDAMYASPIEPWSEYLTGTMGKAPEPFYDPLAFAVDEAHKRGLELHAWFNPYRALDRSSKSPVAANHISKTRPDLVRRYGDCLWLDPGDPDVQIRSLRVVMDVVKRYDIDGVHFDDYFYPYPTGLAVDFPDEATWKKFRPVASANGSNRDDWRRENVNTFIERVHESVHAAKPWVKFGVSPFGIWRPGYPPQIRGMDAYAVIFADSRKWLASGWLDYCAPQLYWPIEPKEHSFPLLLEWWVQQNPKGRHVWAGMNSAKVNDGAWKPAEIVNQIQFTHKFEPTLGHIHWNFSALKNGSNNLASTLEASAYAQPALVPACPWLTTNAPGKPIYFISGLKSGNLRLLCQARPQDTVRQWVFQTRTGDAWTTDILPGKRQFARILGDFHPEVIAITAIGQCGNAGPALVLQKK